MQPRSISRDGFWKVCCRALAVLLAPGAVLVTTTSLTVETIAEEPVIDTDGSGSVTVTIGSGVYAGSYATRHDGAVLTRAMIEAAPTCLVKPVTGGTATVGNTLTITPGLWIYAGADPGDQSWVQRLDGAAIGETGLDYVIQPADAGRLFTVDETFGAVTVTSAATLLSA